MTLKEILEFVNFVANKEQMGQSLTPENYNSLLAGFNTKVFQDELSQVEIIAKAQGVPMYRALYGASSLRPFRTKATLTTDANGIASLPADYVHYTGLLAVYNGAQRDIDVISEEEMINRRSSLMETSLALKPACTLYGSEFQFFPKNLGHTPNGTVELKYLRFPLKPYFDHCVSNETGLMVAIPANAYISDNGGTTTQNLYDDNADLLATDVTNPGNVLPYTSATVELEWEERVHWVFVGLLLNAMGVNLKDEQIRSYKEGS